MYSSTPFALPWMRGTFGAVAAVALLVLGTQSGAQTAPSRYWVISSGKPAQFEMALNQSIRDGYRVVWADAGALLAITERSASSPPSEYRVETELLKAVRDKKVPSGFRILAGSASGPFRALLERSAGDDRNRDYEEAFSIGGTGSLENDMLKRVAEGYRPLGISVNRGDYAIVLERDAGPAAPRAVSTAPTATESPKPYLVLATTLTRTLEKELATSASRGYRLLANRRSRDRALARAFRAGRHRLSGHLDRENRNLRIRTECCRR